MKIIKSISEDEVVAHFLKTEIESERFKQKILTYLETNNIQKTVIDKPNLEDANENKLRKKALIDLRVSTFHNFPENVQWYKAVLDTQDIDRIKYIDYSYWNELSNNTRSPRIAAENVKKGKQIFDESNQGFIEAAKHLQNGGKFPEIILVAKNEKSEPVILEGHLRMTAHFLANHEIDQLEVIIGFSPDIAKWDVI